MCFIRVFWFYPKPSLGHEQIKFSHSNIQLDSISHISIRLGNYIFHHFTYFHAFLGTSKHNRVIVTYYYHSSLSLQYTWQQILFVTNKTKVVAWMSPKSITLIYCLGQSCKLLSTCQGYVYVYIELKVCS